MSGVALMHNNCTDGKSAQYLRQALRSLRDSNKSRKHEGPLATITKKLQWRQVLSCYILVYSIFCFASSCDWTSARDCLGQLEDTLKELDDGPTSLLAHFHVYLSGICFQATGDLRNALRMYRDPKLRLPDRSGPNGGPEEQVQHELSLLAVLNALWIQQADPENSAVQNTAIIARLEPLCANHPNKDLDTAFKLVKATVPTDPPTSGVKIKTYLGATLDATKQTCNKQFLCITLSVMCSRFFVGVVGLQADKAAKAAVFQAKRARNSLWMSVTNSMLAQNLELQGKHEEAKEAKEEARRLAELAFPRPS
jgi:Cohesin loading factor